MKLTEQHSYFVLFIPHFLDIHRYLKGNILDFFNLQFLQTFDTHPQILLFMLISLMPFVMTATMFLLLLLLLMLSMYGCGMVTGPVKTVTPADMH